MTTSLPESPAELHECSGAAAGLEHLVRSWPEPALVADRSGCVLAANSFARALLQSESSLDGAMVARWIGADVAATLLAAGAEPVERTIGADAPAGRHPLLRARAAALSDQHVVICLADASHETDLRSHLDLAERLASIGELLSSVAHELNNPLTTVLGYADLLLAEDDPHLPHAEIERIRSEALRCRRIVGNLLDLARAEAIDLRPVVVNQVVEKVIEFRAYACNSVGVELTAEMSDTPVVLGDFHRLVQAILNLVTNAEDAVRARPHPRRVVVRTRTEDGRAVIEVEDNGHGVPAAVSPFIFQPFFTTKPRGKGTGLGLSLVRSTALQHGGDVACEVSAGGGARFVVALPAAPSA